MSGITRMICQLFVLIAILGVKYLVQSNTIQFLVPQGAGNTTYRLTLRRVNAIAPKNPLINQRAPEKNVSEICGYSALKLVHSTEKADPNEFPWLGALFLAKPKTYLCTVNLITTKHVLTAAHCMVIGTKANKYQVVIGYQQSEPHQMTDIAEIKMHPLYEKKNAGHDLAILTLNAAVEISASVRPVCLIAPSANGGIHSGTVAGFGPNYTTFNKVHLPVVGKRQCRDSHEIFRYLINDNTFCAGQRDSLGPCSGDSGAGFLHFTNGRSYLLGVVSTSLPNNGTCNLSEYVVFASLKNDLEWLRNLLKEFLK